MSYENMAQKKLLQELQEISSKCASNSIEYGKALTAFNLGYGRVSNSLNRKRMPKEEEIKRNELNVVSVRRAKAMILSQMSGLQIRLAKLLPKKMADQIADDQLAGEVFTLDQLEPVIPENMK